LFFFTSRKRHTSCYRDWSSDVCSSDLYGLEAVAADTVQMIRDRTERMSHALRRRPLGVVDAPAETPATGAIRHVRNTTRDRLVKIGRASCRERGQASVGACVLKEQQTA